ncbi:MAG TPA: hypothetical protein VGW78_04860 [Candidatus Babeliales bacterium]|jgi:hypothetical protein|nr:hypothetical protein [Candidatus Babeliales bacterium]
MNAIGLADISYIFSKSVPIIWLKGQYIPTLYTRLRDIAKKNNINIQSLLVSDVSLDTIEAQCSMSFLGQTAYYWLGNYDDLLKKKQDQLRDYLMQYKGPHTLIFAAEHIVPTISSSWYVVDISQQITAPSAYHIIDRWYNTTHQAYVLKSLVAYWYKKTNQPISIEQFFMLDTYARVLGKNITDFVVAYEPYIFIHQPSLFVISQYFFSDNHLLFYQEWAKVIDVYQTAFWIIFWSDQLWRAHAFITYMKNHNKQAAYEISKHKLPYAFSKDGWRHISLSDITEAHNQLYTLDVLTKNGHSLYWIELFFIRWFNRKNII